MVTHPHHPLHGQQVMVIRVRRGPAPDLILQFPDGFYGALSASWTAYAAEPDMDWVPDPPPLLALLGLGQIVQLVAQLRTRQTSHGAGTCTTHGPGYADHGHPCPAAP